jgi:hypothetical protein
LGGRELDGVSGRSDSRGRDGQHEGEIILQGCDGFQGQVAGVLDRPFVVLSQEDGADEAGARRHTEEANETPVTIMRDEGRSPPQERSATAETLLNLVWGAPTPHMEVETWVGQITPHTDEKLLQQLQAHMDQKR